MFKEIKKKTEIEEYVLITQSLSLHKKQKILNWRELAVWKDTVVSKR